MGLDMGLEMCLMVRGIIHGSAAEVRCKLLFLEVFCWLHPLVAWVMWAGSVCYTPLFKPLLC